MKPPTFVNARSSSLLPLLLALGGLFLAGCGATAPIIESMNAPQSLQTNETGTFEASINEDADEPLTYTWDFGDGSSGSGLLATHSYNRSGTYTVTFTASNEGGTVTDQAEVSVTRPPQPASITTINATPNPAEEGETVNFSSNVRGDTPISYSWDFGDGSTGSGASGSHTYSDVGTYTVTLDASNNAGQDSRTLSVTVEPSLPPICMSVSELNAAFFGRNSSTLTEEGSAALQENLDILSQCPNLSVRVEGFAAPGERSTSSLSEDRARAVAQFYQDNGVEQGRISTQAQGEPTGVTTKRGGTRQYRRADSIPQR